MILASRGPCQSRELVVIISNFYFEKMYKVDHWQNIDFYGRVILRLFLKKQEFVNRVVLV